MMLLPGVEEKNLGFTERIMTVMFSKSFLLSTSFEGQYPTLEDRAYNFHDVSCFYGTAVQLDKSGKSFSGVSSTHGMMRCYSNACEGYIFGDERTENRGLFLFLFHHLRVPWASTRRHDLPLLIVIDMMMGERRGDACSYAGGKWKCSCPFRLRHI